MKTVGVALLMLLAGYLLGGWGPSGQLLEAEKQLAEARDKLAAKSGRGRTVLSGVSQMLDFPDDLSEVSREGGGQEEVALVDPDVPEQVSPVEPGDGEEVAATNETFRNQIDTAVDAWAIRSEIARNGFVEQAALDETQAIRFDVLVEAMNIRIGATIEQFVEQYRDVDQVMAEEFGQAFVGFDDGGCQLCGISEAECYELLGAEIGVEIAALSIV